MTQKIYWPKNFLTQKFFWPKNFFDPKSYLTEIFFNQHFFWSKLQQNNYYLWLRFFDQNFWTTFLTTKKFLTTNQMGFDTIEINLVVVYWWFEPYIYLPLLLHSGESVGGMVALNKKTVVSYCFLISKISLPVHNFGIKM